MFMILAHFLNHLIHYFHSLHLYSSSQHICSFAKYLRTLIMVGFFRDAIMNGHLPANCETYPLFHPFLSLSIILLLFLFTVCLLFWTCNRMCLLLFASISLLQTQALKAGDVFIMKSTFDILFCDKQLIPDKVCFIFII